VKKKVVSGMILATLFIGMFTLAFNIKPVGPSELREEVGVVQTYKLNHIPTRMHGDKDYLYYTDAVAHRTGKLYRVNKADGSEELFFNVGGDMIFVEGDYLYVSESIGLSTNIWKLDKRTAEIIWHWRGYGSSYGYGVGKYGVYGRGAWRGNSFIWKENGTVKWTSDGITRYPDQVLPDLKNDVVIETGLWSTNTIQRVSKVDGSLIWRRRGPTEDMGEATRAVDITDDVIWVEVHKGTYPNQFFYALGKWDRETGETLEIFPELPYRFIAHVGPEGSLTFDFPDERGNALVWEDPKFLRKVNTLTWEVYWTTDLGPPLIYCSEWRPFIDGNYIYLVDWDDPTIIYQFLWRAPAIPATLDINPDTLNLKSKGKWITAYIELPEGYNVNDIDISTVKLNNKIEAELHPTEIGDYDTDGIPDLMVKFDRQELIATLSVGEATLTITGKVNETLFEGSDTIRVIDE
jgi:hypothetical protein